MTAVSSPILRRFENLFARNRQQTDPEYADSCERGNVIRFNRNGAEMVGRVLWVNLQTMTATVGVKVSEWYSRTIEVHSDDILEVVQRETLDRGAVVLTSTRGYDVVETVWAIYGDTVEMMSGTVRNFAEIAEVLYPAETAEAVSA